MYNSIDFDSRKYLIGLNATKFISLMDHYGLGNYLNNQTTNKTILAPMNDVIDEDDIPNNQKLQWLSYHIIDGAWSSKDLYDNMLLTTKYHSPQLNDQPQRLVVNIDQTIMFGGDHSRMVGKEVSIKGNEIYKLSNPLSLPTDIFTTLVIDLDVSSFISALYVSGVVNDIKTTKAITLFAPINDAFKSLGLLSRYLLHPSGHSDLQTILQYHVALTPLYHSNILNTVQQTKTLVNDTLFINGSNHHQIWLGRNRHALESEEQSELVTTDILVSNGVVHKVNKLLIPERVNITHRHLLNGINANLMESILKQTGLIDQIDMTDWIILVPTDKAFEQIDLESMWNDTTQLERIAKLHILSRNHRLPLLGEQEYETLLSEDRVILRDAGSGNKIIKVRGQPLGIHAHVLDIGYVTTGNRLGGIIEIDSVLFPVERGIFGLPLTWSITITSIFWIACIVSLFAVCYRLGKKWNRKQSGYVPISDTPQIDIAQQEEAEASHRIYQ
ncbi:hypothetical protein RMATCC62417_13284 [Rhizopus microsporus]|nr:hypothetical protein RMATCC62417_13284 [Rhizopus microsporus]